MKLVEIFDVSLGGDHSAKGLLYAVRSGPPELARTILEVDLKTFNDASLTASTAASLVKHGLIFLLKVDGEVAGTSVCIRSFDDPDEAVIYSVGVLPAWRGRGMGSRMVRGMMKSLTDRGFYTVAAQLGRGNQRAVQMYRELGFQEEGEGVAHPIRGTEHVVMRGALRQLVP